MHINTHVITSNMFLHVPWGSVKLQTPHIYICTIQLVYIYIYIFIYLYIDAHTQNQCGAASDDYLLAVLYISESSHI